MDAQESSVYISIILAVSVITIVLVYFFLSIVRHHKKVLRLERENSEAQVELLEKDRSRIAADLHDEVAPMLVAVKMRINSFALSTEDDLQSLKKANAAIDEVATRMRGIAFDLMPSTLIEKGLTAAVESFISHWNGKTKLRIVFESPRELRLNELVSIHIYRIIQETIHNTIKHADAGRLSIVLRNDGRYLLLTSQDDGKGFDYRHELKSSSGLGLKSLLNRVHLLRAEFWIESEEGKGTSITIQIPTAGYETVLPDKSTYSRRS